VITCSLDFCEDCGSALESECPDYCSYTACVTVGGVRMPVAVARTVLQVMRECDIVADLRAVCSGDCTHYELLALRIEGQPSATHSNWEKYVNRVFAASV
jgi:hypothetical protein